MNPARSAIELANVKMSMNPFDEIATEEGQRREEGTRLRRDRAMRREGHSR